MAEYLRVKNWDEFQHYKDRSPPWIKLHRDLLNNYEFSCLQTASKAHLMLIWLLASQLDNKIPNDPEWISRRVNINETINLKPLINGGFIVLEQSASSALAKRSPETEAETEAETETELITRLPKTENARFEEWWIAYDKKVDRKKCEAKWQRINWKKLDITPDYLITDAIKRHADCAKWAAGYQPNPLTYLNGERWNDELQQPNKQQPTAADEYAQRKRRENAILSEINGGNVGDDEQALPPAMVTYQR